jgi:hypothetical protein
MVNITIEYMILIPLLILQIFLLPYAAGVMMNYWSTSSETIALEDAASHLGSSIQQLYLFLNNPNLSTISVTNDLGVPTYINGYAYNGTANLAAVSGSNSENILTLTLSMIGTPVSASSIVTLGENVQWNPSLTTFTSSNPGACIIAQKSDSGSMVLSFAT